MTRKDYVMLSTFFADTRPPATLELRRDQWTFMRNALGHRLFRQNPRFDVARFVKDTESRHF